MSKQHQKKTKLRPARDVISRLKWSAEPPYAHEVVFGYIDRVNGTMEKSVADYTPMDEGGDIPEHRILYFRRIDSSNEGEDWRALSRNVIWDRAGRVDRVFGSGYGNSDISAETIQEATNAVENMARLEEEKAERREQKARERARRARTRAAERKATPAVSESGKNDAIMNESRYRFEWRRIPWYQYDESVRQWKEGEDESINANCKTQSNGGDTNLSIMTWNVLSDIYPGIDTDENGTGGHHSRWSLLAEAIYGQSPDIVALQEATPDFVEQLMSIDWIRKEYTSSIAPCDKSPVDPLGQILLWRRSSVVASELYACIDGGRWRALSATFLCGTDLVICANVHLPADKPAIHAGEMTSRQVARRRELSAIVGHLQRVETQLRRDASQRVDGHIILGDFNCGALELEDGVFAGGGYFKDVWSQVRGTAGEDSGFTFDPKTNPRSAKSSTLVAGSVSARRIDRIYLNNSSSLEPISSEVLRGVSESVAIPPSDHYGVLARFASGRTQARNGPSTTGVALYDPSKYNAWAAITPPSKDYMVAIILDSVEMERIKSVYDPDSTLFSPHITLLYGFAEMHRGSLDLAIQAVKDSIRSAFTEQRSPMTLSFSEESLDVFEHRSSATLVALGDGGNKWLTELYHSLRSRFSLCNDQEQHSADGYRPHVTLGKFGSTAGARKVACEHVGTVSTQKIPIRSVDILERGSGGKFVSIATVPFSSPPVYHGLQSIIADTGSLASSYFSDKSKIVMSLINRASRAALKSLEGNQITSEVKAYGSVALNSSLPKLSDLDVVITLSSDLESDSKALLALDDKDCSYLRRLMSCLSDMRTVETMRLRPLRSGLVVLSIHVQPDLPSVDILLCVMGPYGKPLRPNADGPFDSLEDNAYLIAALSDIEERMKGALSFSIRDLFCASLRLVKLWAFNRGVYGAKHGFLGGGAWAIFLAQIIQNMFLESGTKDKFTRFQSLSEAAHYLTLAFFEEASRWPWPRPVAISSNDCLDQYAQPQPRLVVLSQSSGSNLAKNSTISTCLSTSAELLRASRLIQGKLEGDLIPTLQGILAPLKLQALIGTSAEIISLELRYDEQLLSAQQLPEDVEALGCGQYLSLLVHLEKKLGDASLLRPYSRTLKQSEGFAWIVGFHGLLTNDLRASVNDVCSRVVHPSGGGIDNDGYMLSASLLSSGDAMELFAIN